MRQDDHIIFKMYQEGILKKAAPLALGATILAGSPSKSQEPEGMADTEKYIYSALPEKDRLSYDISRQTNYQNVMFGVVETVQKLLSGNIDNEQGKKELQKTFQTEDDQGTIDKINSILPEAPESSQNILNWILKNVFVPAEQK